MNATPDLFAPIQAEHWLASRLDQLRCPIPPGPSPLKDRIRAAITASGFAPVIVGRGPDGKAETFEAAFERIYGEPLVPVAPRKSRSTQHKVTA